MGLAELCPIVAADRARADVDARMTPEVRRAATEAGIWLLVAPREVGGAEVSLPELATVFEQLGRADPAFCWIAMNSTITELMGAFLPPDVAEEVLVGTDGPFGLSAAPTDMDAARVEGGWRVNARFRFMTGSEDARWCTALGLDAHDPAAGMYAFVMPLTDLCVTSNWVDAAAMRGTGSNAVMGTDVFVPEARVVALARPPRIDRPTFRVAPFVTLWIPCAAMVIGALRAAMETCVELVADKVGSDPTRTPYIESGRLRQTLADSAAVIECLSAGLRAVVDDLWAAAMAGQRPSLAVRARWWSLLFHVFDAARHTVSDLHRSAGSSVYGTRNPLERSMRDIHAIATTFEQPPAQALRLDAGRVLAGKDPVLPFF